MKGTPSPRASTAWVAIAQIITGVMLFSCSDTTAKFLRGSLPAVEIAWIRYVVFVVLSLAITARGHLVGRRPRRPALQVLRGVTLLGSAVFFIAGLSQLQMAEAAAISFVSPAFITALSVVVLGEKVGIRRWAATLAGLVGVVMVIRPGSGALQTAALYPLSSAACWAVALVITRRIGLADRGETTLLWSACVGLAILTVLLPFNFVVPSPQIAALGIMLGAASSTGQYLLILAYRGAPASLLAPFSYVQLLCSATLGYLVFGGGPDTMALLGAAVIVGSGLYTVHRERVRARLAREASQTTA